MARPLVSVLVDTYNHERYIGEALSSVLAQDYPDADREILVVDDGSTDRTPQILREFEPHVRILHKANGGQASAFNFAIPQCRGEIVAFLDGDDAWMPTKLTCIVEAFSSRPSLGVVGHSVTEVLDDGTRRSELVRDAPQFRIDSPAGARIFRLRKSFLGTSRLALRAELLRRIGPVPEALVFEADEFLFTLGALFSEVFLLREPLALYRLHSQNHFQLSGSDSIALRRKHAVLTALADSLRLRFDQERVAGEIARPVIDAIQLEADVLRLSLDGGSPADTIRVEMSTYRMMHEKASVVRWMLKCASLFPALFVSAKTYAALKQRLANNSIYRRVRRKVWPNLQPSHVDRTGQWSR